MNEKGCLVSRRTERVNLSLHWSNNRLSTTSGSVTSINKQFVLQLQALRVDPIYACSKRDTRDVRAGQAERTAQLRGRFIRTSYTNLTCGCLLGVFILIVPLKCKCMTSMHTRPKVQLEVPETQAAGSQQGSSGSSSDTMGISFYFFRKKIKLKNSPACMLNLPSEWNGL